jgi:hypothetical protein
MDISAALAEHGAQADAQTLALGERRAPQRAFAGTRQVGTQSLAQVLAGVAAEGARACAEAGRNTKGMLAHARRRSQRCKAYGAGRWVVAAAQARTALQAALQGQERSLMLLDDAIAAARLSSLDSAMLQQLLNAREHLQVLRFRVLPLSAAPTPSSPLVAPAQLHACRTFLPFQCLSACAAAARVVGCARQRSDPTALHAQCADTQDGRRCDVRGCTSTPPQPWSERIGEALLSGIAPKRECA